MKHDNYEILNLIGYGLAKFDTAFVYSFGYKSKAEFFNQLVKDGLAETTGVIKNRQDLFDPFFENGRKGWWQKGDAYIHRKQLIDSLFGDLGVRDYTDIIKLYLHTMKPEEPLQENLQPIIKSKFRRLQETGLEAELYFISNYSSTNLLNGGLISDARLFGDGYDFQIQVDSYFYLVEVKGVKSKTGGLRLTSNEFKKAETYQEKFVLAVVSNLVDLPKLTLIQNPLNVFNFERREQIVSQTFHYTQLIKW
ncbi:protein NO VEIN domain-containing protein [Spirosoma areae]